MSTLARNLRAARESEGGFTLVELLIVILIIGVLAAIATPMFLNQRRVAVDASVASDVRNAALAVETATIQVRGAEYAIQDGGPAVGGTDTARLVVVNNGYIVQTVDVNTRVSQGTELTFTTGPAGGYVIHGFNAGGKDAAQGTGIEWSSDDGGL